MSSLNGEFSPRNVYLLAIKENLEAPDFHGKWIWKLQNLTKIKLFLWKCLHLSLPVKSILAHQGIGRLGGNDSYLDLEESIVHVLRDYPAAKTFWECTSCPDSLKHSFSNYLE